MATYGNGAPEEQALDLAALLKPPSDLTRVVTDPTMGRITVASRSLEKLGCHVVREEPAIVWSNWSGFFTKFQALPPRLKRAILDMFHPPLDSAAISPMRAMAVLLAVRLPDMNVELAHKLIAICNTNAHMYYGKADIAYHEFIRDPNSPPRETRSALFIYSSKVAHSCAPQLAYTSKTNDGCLEYKLIRPAEEGDSLTFSYLEKLYETPTCARRASLLESKSFHCECSRCMGPDYCRLLRCPAQGCSNFVTVTNPTADKSLDLWACPDCGVIDGPQMKSLLSKEESLNGQLLQVEAMASRGAGLSIVEKLIGEASTSLSPLHWVSIAGKRIRTTMYASQAAQLNQLASFGMGGSPLEERVLRLKAAVSGLEGISASECVASGCNGLQCSVETPEKHAPLYECATEMFHACQDLMAVAPKLWPSYVVLTVKRYLLVMRISFGENDRDVLEIERKICGQAQVCDHKSNATKSTGKKSRQSNKKKRGKKK